MTKKEIFLSKTLFFMSGFDTFVGHCLEENMGSCFFEEDVIFFGCENDIADVQELVYHPCNFSCRSLGEILRCILTLSEPKVTLCSMLLPKESSKLEVNLEGISNIF